ncbi:ras-related protein rab-28-like protein [Neocallimastix californiae]|uniref:Ras-related protein rab-28-like protein n=1 Tax=Neocallimastix californiae TaxID=1754190 RepID=A0A1Y2C486_9FUNG|nr:ras-related protein rab-28-like protein [Neocallimastix californiae]|eukprot:ORY41766.1 ras-related protein rab-28-like protein [Neocallimastix californiae]
MLEQSNENNKIDNEEPQIKIVMLGNEISGKTSIAQRFSQDTFPIQYEQTLGLDFYSKRINLSSDVTANIQIWDIGGQAINNKMIANYLYGAHAILFCYDITHALSFQNLENVDLYHMQTVTKEMHENFINNNKINGFYVSAKTGENINNMFLQIISTLLGISYYKKQYESKNISKVISRNDPNASLSSELERNSKLNSKQETQCVIS